MGISRYTTPVEQTLEKYVPVPMDSIYKAAEKIQERGDLAQQQRDELETGLGSLEAYAPAQRDFISNYTNEFRTKSSELLGKYQNNTSDPEFIRESRKLNMQFARDPRLQIIKQTNEKIKLNEQIASKLQAEGKLFIKPEFTGVDSKGRLTAEVGNVQGINTLDEWSNAGKVAHASTELVGNMLTNERNLEGFRQGILGDVEGQAKLVKAYMQQGMSQQEAANAVKTNIRGIIDQYGVVTRPDTSFESLALQKQQIRQGAYQFEQTRQDRKAEAEAARNNALEIARIKAAKKEDDSSNVPSFRKDNTGFTTSAPTTKTEDVNKSKQFVPSFGHSTINTPTPMGSGLENFGGAGYFRQNASTDNKSYNGTLVKQRGAANIKNGQFEGVSNVAVDTKGNIITSKNKGDFIEKNGKTYYTYKNDDNKNVFVEAKPMSMKVYTDKGTGSIYYSPATEHEAMRYMGATASYWEGKRTIADDYNIKPNKALPKEIIAKVNNINLADPNELYSLLRVGNKRGYDNKDIENTFLKVSNETVLNDKETAILSNILTDIQNQQIYNMYNKGEFNNQGKRGNIFNPSLKESNDNTYTQLDVNDAVEKALKDLNDD